MVVYYHNIQEEASEAKQHTDETDLTDKDLI
jgi:hypothetical protein